MPTELPKISVITINYNRREELRQTIESVVAQQYPNLEYIVVDGGSTDGSLEVIKAYEKYISYWVSEPDEGIYCALNKGLGKVTGKWFNFMNAGDFFSHPDSLFRFQECFNSKYSLVYSDCYHLYPNGHKIPSNQKGLFKYTLFLNALNHQSIFFNSAKSINLKYDTNLKIASDLDLIVRLYFQCENRNDFSYHIKNQYLTTYRMGGFSSQHKSLLIKERREVMKKLPVLYKIPSLIYHYYRGY